MLLNNRYQVLRILGEGGFGQAYLAEDTQMPSRRQCVIKQLKPITHSPDVYKIVKDRFQREAAILEQLGENHPQIPRLYAYFNEGQNFYLVQEWIEGQTLEEAAIQQLPQSESTVISLLRALLPVLDFIHAQGIIHRDIKPGNIILRADTQQPVLIDFGAVRETMGTVLSGQTSGPTSGPTSSQTPKSSIVIGTPGYMPSEQAAGRPVPASDVYSLALVAVYLLTGQQPQSLAAHPQTGELIWQPGVHSIDSELAAILTRAIQFHPRDRYQSAREMLDALTALSIHDPQNQTVVNLKTVAIAPVHSVPSQPLGHTQPSSRATANPKDVTSQQSQPWRKALIPMAVGLIAVALGGGWVLGRMSEVSEVTPGASSVTQSVTPEPSESVPEGSGSATPESVTPESGSAEPSKAGGSNPSNVDRSEAGEPVAQPSAETENAPARAAPKQDDHSFEACMLIYAYDPEDTFVNMRDRPDGEVIRQLPNLSAHLMEGPASAEPGWNRLYIGDSEAIGYVWGDLLYRTYYQVQDPNDTYANLRQAPNGDVITAVSNGTEVAFRGIDGDWTEVQLEDGRRGYILTSMLTVPSCF